MIDSTSRSNPYVAIGGPESPPRSLVGTFRMKHVQLTGGHDPARAAPPPLSFSGRPVVMPFVNTANPGVKTFRA